MGKVGGKCWVKSLASKGKITDESDVAHRRLEEGSLYGEHYCSTPEKSKKGGEKRSNSKEGGLRGGSSRSHFREGAKSEARIKRERLSGTK